MIYTNQISQITDLLRQNGLNDLIIYLILTIPIITLLISFTRIFIGVQIGTYLTSIIFILTALIIGIEITLLVVLISFGLGALFRYLLSQFHFHFASKTSFVLSFAIIGLLLLTPWLLSLPLLSYAESLHLVIYGILISSIQIEKYINFKITSTSVKQEFLSLIRTLIFTTIIFFILGGPIVSFGGKIEFSSIKNIIQIYPDIILVAFLLNIFVGLYTGLRVTEIIKFRKMIFNK